MKATKATQTQETGRKRTTRRPQSGNGAGVDAGKKRGEILSSVAERLGKMGGDCAEIAEGLEAIVRHCSRAGFTIVNAGVMNPGKSTLFNALLGRAECFKTADVRETTVAKTVEWEKGMLLVDTPGCGSSDSSDDSEAFNAFRSADVVLFVHNLANGGLTKSEIRILRELMKTFGDEEFANRVFMVATRTDECADETTVAASRREIAQLVQDNLGRSLVSFAVSPILHLKGVEAENAGKADEAKVLKKAAGIDALARHLKKCRRALGDAFEVKVAPLVARLKELSAGIGADVRKEKTSVAAEKKAILDDWRLSEKKIEEAWRDCKGTTAKPSSRVQFKTKSGKVVSFSKSK